MKGRAWLELVPKKCLFGVLLLLLALFDQVYGKKEKE